MILRAPNFFENFKCLGGDCKKSCCIGWELEVDEDTFSYYNSVPGIFGDRLRSELKKSSPGESANQFSPYAGHSFATTVNGRCPFLNDKNLCDIVLELGEEALCDICSNYPRYTFSFGDNIEKSLTISCEEAARLLFEETDGIVFAEGIYDDEAECFESDNEEYQDTTDYIQDESDLDYDEFEEYEEPSEAEIKEFLNRRQADFAIIKDRSKSFNKRLLALCENENPADKYPELASKEERLRILSLLEPIDREWVDLLSDLQDMTFDWDADLTETKDSEFVWDEIAYENLLVYFLFRYSPRSLYDGDYESKLRFALFCIFCIRDISKVMGDLRLAASTFSREVEHSEENILTIIEELIF